MCRHSRPGYFVLCSSLSALVRKISSWQIIWTRPTYNTCTFHIHFCLAIDFRTSVLEMLRLPSLLLYPLTFMFFRTCRRQVYSLFLWNKIALVTNLKLFRPPWFGTRIVSIHKSAITYLVSRSRSCSLSVVKAFHLSQWPQRPGVRPGPKPNGASTGRQNVRVRDRCQVSMY